MAIIFMVARTDSLVIKRYVDDGEQAVGSINGLGFRVEGFRMQGLGFRDWPLRF